MPSAKNIQQVQQLKEKLAHAKSAVLADYSGLPVNKQQELKEQVKQAGGQLTVVKNNLLKIALQNTVDQTKQPQNKETVETALIGPTILVTAEKDEIAPLKALVQFNQESKIPRLKLGILADRILNVEEIKELAKLPSYQELTAKLIGTINAPIIGFVTVLQANTKKLVQVLSAIKEVKSNS